MGLALKIFRHNCGYATALWRKNPKKVGDVPPVVGRPTDAAGPQAGALRSDAVERPAVKASSPSGAERLTDFWSVPPSIQAWTTGRFSRLDGSNIKR